MKTRKMPFTNQEWLRNQLTKGNDIFSRIIMFTLSVSMLTMALMIGGIIPTIPSSQAAELNDSGPSYAAFAQVAESAANPIIMNAAISIGIQSAPIASTYAVRQPVVKEPAYVKKEPHDTMEDYDTTVFVAYNGGVNIRSFPNEDTGEIIGTYDYRDEVHVLKKGDGWLYTSDGNYIYENATSTSQPPSISYLGKFKTTAYCTCPICCGSNSKHGVTRTGTVPTEGRTIAVDPAVIPLHSKVIINGHEYIAEDTGSAVNGNTIDFYINGHSRASAHGVQYMDVYIYN